MQQLVREEGIPKQVSEQEGIPKRKGTGHTYYSKLRNLQAHILKVPPLAFKDCLEKKNKQIYIFYIFIYIYLDGERPALYLQN